MKITKLDAATSQLATAIWLYFEDRDPVSVYTLAMAASEIIDRICDSKGTPAMRQDFFATIIPERRKEVVDALNKPSNFFKHASSSRPNQVLEDFSDERNLFAILMAADGLRLLDAEMIETRIFKGWVNVVEPRLMLVPPPDDLIAGIFGAIRDQPRAVQKQCGRDALHLARKGKLPDQ